MDTKTFCLGILSFGDATGYEIKKQLEGPFRHFYDASFGSIYPALSKLSDAGLVERTELAQDKRPDKKVYSITPAGKMTLMDELSKPVSEDKMRSDFLATVVFSELLTPSAIDNLIADRIEKYEEAIRQLDCDDNNISPGAHFVCGFGKAVYSAALDYLQNHQHEIVGHSLMTKSEKVQ
jgi:PadR family transcriptional regulator, regulatory protein AphA